jgi:hypothetical protein
VSRPGNPYKGRFAGRAWDEGYETALAMVQPLHQIASVLVGAVAERLGRDISPELINAVRDAVVGCIGGLTTRDYVGMIASSVTLDTSPPARAQPQPTPAKRNAFETPASERLSELYADIWNTRHYSSQRALMLAIGIFLEEKGLK